VLNIAEQNKQNFNSGRLKKRPEFLYVAGKGDKWVSESVIVQSIETDKDAVKLGYTATKKIGNAVIRNRCKRRMRAATDEIMRSENLKSADIVLIARHSTATCEWDKLIKDLRWCLKRLSVL